MPCSAQAVCLVHGARAVVAWPGGVVAQRTGAISTPAVLLTTRAAGTALALTNWFSVSACSEFQLTPLNTVLAARSQPALVVPQVVFHREKLAKAGWLWMPTAEESAWQRRPAMALPGLLMGGTGARFSCRDSLHQKLAKIPAINFGIRKEHVTF